jgi:hypothetical protein
VTGRHGIMSIELMADEDLISSGWACLLEDGKSSEILEFGKLHLTSERLVFKPFQIDAIEEDCELAKITGTRLGSFRLFGMLPVGAKRLTVTVDQESPRFFAVWSAEHWADAICQAAEQCETSLILNKLIAEAETGNPDAQFCLGDVYLTGDLVPGDAARGHAWLAKAQATYRAAAQAGDAGAQFGLGHLLFEYYDRQEAIGWISKAASQGHEEAQQWMKSH